jgi:hypothetical protein
MAGTKAMNRIDWGLYNKVLQNNPNIMYGEEKTLTSEEICQINQHLEVAQIALDCVRRSFDVARARWKEKH